MATLSISKTYEDDVLLNASDIDAIVDDVETFVNTTGLNDDNINAASITASSKFKTASITTAKIADSAITSAKLAAESISTAKIVDDAVTKDKIADDTLVRDNFYALAPLADAGKVMMFHTFNGAVSIPRGWMKCDGSQILQSTYDSLHGAGAYETDEISSSPLLANYLPDMADRYARGTSNTTESGVTPISSNGNPDNQVDLEHNHSLDNHTHTKVTAGLGVSNVPINNWLEVNPSGSTSGIESETVSQELSSAQSIQPESIEFIFIMKVI